MKNILSKKTFQVKFGESLSNITYHLSKKTAFMVYHKDRIYQQYCSL
jgi:hypothetical protein